MRYPSAEQIAETFKSNHWLIGLHLEGLSHADSLVQPPFPANCLNWVLGHIIRGRNTALLLLSAQPVLDEPMVTRFKTGSPPVTGQDDAVDFAQLLQWLDLSQELLARALEAASPDDLAEEKRTERGVKPLAQHLSGLAWHETYHTGQLDLLRSLALSQRAD